MEFNFNFNNATFTFLVGSRRDERFSRSIPFMDGCYTVNFTARTDCSTSQNGDIEACILGFCTDAYGQLRPEDIPGLITSLPTIADLIVEAKRFAGSFIILYKNRQGFYLLPDATGSLQAFYSVGPQGTFVASSSQYIADSIGCSPSEQGKNLFYGNLPLSGAQLPLDATVYDEISVLLPDHYVNLLTGESHRIPHLSPDSVYDLDEILSRSLSLIRNITTSICGHYDLLCPLTAGWDSRLNLAFLLDGGYPVQSFTFQHTGPIKSDLDVHMAVRICSDLHVDHTILTDQVPPASLLSEIAHLTEKHHFSECDLSPFNNHITLAYTLSCYRPNAALLNGNGIEHIGRCSLFRHFLKDADISPSLLCQKSMNSSPQARADFTAFCRQFREAGREDQLYDAFMLESRLGRWAAESNLIYSLMGISSLNLYNCGALLDLWRAIAWQKRNARSKPIISLGIYRAIGERLLQYPFNPKPRPDLRTRLGNVLNDLLPSALLRFLHIRMLNRNKLKNEG